MEGLRSYFFRLSDELQAMMQGDERFVAALSGEDSDFVRLNHGRIRQAGHVSQRSLSLDLICESRHASGQCGISGELEPDRLAVAALVIELRAQRALLGDDPHLLYSEEATGIVREDVSQLPPNDEVLQEVASAAEGLDLVGIWASGGIHAGFANSFGQRSWHSAYTFNFDFSCYLRADRAVKNSYAGTQWNRHEFSRLFARTRTQLQALDREPKSLTPGRYRAYIAPAAVEDLLGMLRYGGFSSKAHRTQTTPLLRLASGEVAFHRDVTLVQDSAGGLTPAFTMEGFRKAELVTLVKQGRLHDLLISPRSAKEFTLKPNAGGEWPDSLAMLGGDLDREAVLSRLGTGILINNVWYCNFSDPNACRITGMTRFACFWVENGEIVAPLTVMRFDDSLYGILGDRLLGITRQRELRLSSSTYGGRSLSSTLVPGLLVEGLALTL